MTWLFSAPKGTFLMKFLQIKVSKEWKKVIQLRYFQEKV